MGVISRQVFPVCESLCFFCPALRARSRHPVKRYKQMLAEIFPRSPDEEPNDRKISKLCEYASKTPLRIPKITTTLEQRCYKDLRTENFHSVKVVMCIYRKLLVSCKEQMPLFASSVLSIVQILLDQTRHDEIRLLGCETLFEFVNNQKDGTYMFNLDGMIPKLCLLAQETREDGMDKRLRSAGLQVLSSMVWFMGEFSHISSEFDSVVSVVLENHGGPKKKSDKQDTQTGSSEEVSSSLEPVTRISSWRLLVSEKGEVLVAGDDMNNPIFWSRVCLHNIAKLAKEATTVRRVLESLFRYFDNGDLWSPKHGLALSVLMDMQIIIENYGQNRHFILSILIKHLDHKNVLKNPNMQLDIVDVATSLAREAKVQSSVAIIGALSDMMRHLRKSIHCSLDDSNLGAEVIEWNQKFQAAVDECLVQLIHKVGDAGPVLDMMAVMLENMTNITVMARTLISTVYRTGQIVATIPNLTYQNKTMSLRLSTRQITLLLSSIWAQSISPLNTPENYEAIANTYSLVLLYARTKNTSDETLIRSFQLAFSLRSISLGGGLQPSRRRSLFTLATSMIIFSAKAYNVVALAPCAKAALTNETVDPFLRLVDDHKLQAVNSGPDQVRKVYGSKEDDENALRSLSAIEKSENQSKESFATMIVQTLRNSPEDSSIIKQQLLNDFMPDDACPLGAPLSMETPIEIDQVGVQDDGEPDKAEPPLFTIEDDVLANASENQTEPDTKVAVESLSLISIDELLNSVSETTHQVGRLSVSVATNMPYMEMAGQCEALQMGKQQKLSTFIVAQQRQESLIRFSNDCNQQEKETPSLLPLGAPTSGNPFLESSAVSLNQSVGNGSSMLCATEYQYYPHFQLPASSPYDNFLKAAGC
ncbi:protein SEMI-ROLLED LEAF 2 isoform X2 [Malus sylvestris]|uniref:protein SEMI-ROLLED LEAF 2 isoform X2 n=1 Tax=Malus sylvestris TaxID=3752 RepID=UPI0021AC5822|nr:protein SEMI-ROLLED LEAF 2 isoform X2 [Malus sylvestris]